MTAPTVTSGVGSIQIIDAQIQSAGDMTLKSGGDILIKRNLSGSTRVDLLRSDGGRRRGDLTFVNSFDPGGSVELKSAGNQSIQLKGALSDLVAELRPVVLAAATLASVPGAREHQFHRGRHAHTRPDRRHGRHHECVRRWRVDRIGGRANDPQRRHACHQPHRRQLGADQSSYETTACPVSG